MAKRTLETIAVLAPSSAQTTTHSAAWAPTLTLLNRPSLLASLPAVAVVMALNSRRLPLSPAARPYSCLSQTTAVSLKQPRLVSLLARAQAVAAALLLQVPEVFLPLHRAAALRAPLLRLHRMATTAAPRQPPMSAHRLLLTATLVLQPLS